MRGLDTGLFLLLGLWMCFIHTGYCNYAEILRGQCYAFCLTRHESRQKAPHTENQRLSSDSAIRDCKKDRQCKWCLYACERERESYDDHTGCMNDCKASRTRRYEPGLQACNDSCRFIAKSSEAKFGKCPAATDMEAGRHTACVNECGKDLDCDGMEKCCDNGCGRICHRPVDYEVFPPVPSGLKFKERKDGGLIIEWKNATGAFIKPLLYITRWWCSYTNYVLHEITTKPKVKLKGYPNGVRPGAKCNFMVAAVNIHGSAGFSAATLFIKKFLHPSKPLNLENSRNKLHDGKVDVTIRWQPPLYTDGVPVTKYLVFWSDPLPQASPKHMRLRMHKKSVHSGQMSYTIANLDQGTIYFVQVKAVVSWEDKSIRGKPASIHIQTYASPQPAGAVDTGIPDGVFSQKRIHNINISDAVFIKSQLKANVTWSLYPGTRIKSYKLYWTRDVCDGEARHRKTRDRLEMEATSESREFQLFNLYSQCVYELKIHPVNVFGKHEEGAQQYFRTPPCWETKGDGLEKVCPPKVSPPLPPDDMAVRFKYQSGCVCQAVVSWQRPSGDDGKINHFSVRWGQSRPPPSGESSLQLSTVVYNTSPYKIQVPGNDTRACMTYLESGKHYTVQVIAHVAKLRSPPAILHFFTPEIMPTCYGVDHESSKDLNDDDEADVTVTQEMTTARMAENKNSSPPRNFSVILVVMLCLLHLCF